MIPVPTPRFGREDQVDIKQLLDVQSLVQKWKGKFCRLKGQPNGMTNHPNWKDCPSMIHLEKAKSEDASLIPMLGGKQDYVNSTS